MRASRYLPTRWMIDRAFLNLKLDTRMLLVSMWTWPETPTSGLTIVDPTTVGRAHGFSTRRVAQCVVELEQAGFIEIDPHSSVIWLIGYLETQLGAMPNASHRANTGSAIRALPDTEMVRRYRQKYGVTDRMPGTVSERVSVREVDRVPDREVDRRSLPVLSSPKSGAGRPKTTATKRGAR